MLALVMAGLPADAVLGSWDAGVVGYFADQPVINLDGVVNSFDYLEASREGTQGEFLRDRDLAYLVNHGALVDGEDPDIHEPASDLLGEGTADGLDQVHREEFTYSGTTTGAAGPSGPERTAGSFRQKASLPGLAISGYSARASLTKSETVRTPTKRPAPSGADSLRIKASPEPWR